MGVRVGGFLVSIISYYQFQHFLKNFSVEKKEKKKKRIDNCTQLKTKNNASSKKTVISRKCAGQKK